MKYYHLQLTQVNAYAVYEVVATHQFDDQPSKEDILELANIVDATRYQLIKVCTDGVLVKQEEISPIVSTFFRIDTSVFLESASMRHLTVTGDIKGQSFIFEVYDSANPALSYEKNSIKNDALADELNNIIGHFYRNETYTYVSDLLAQNPANNERLTLDDDVLNLNAKYKRKR